MGCDVHAFKEKLVDDTWTDNNEWETHDEGTEYEYKFTESARISRNYLLFGTICRGVRFDNTLGFEEKGLPTDVSSEIKESSDHWDTDGHSHSWLRLDEILLKISSVNQLVVLNGAHQNEIQGVRELQVLIDCFTKEEQSQPEQHRLVFWFDN